MKKALPPSNLEDYLGYWLRCLSNFVSESFTKKLSVYDISVAQWVLLRILYDNNGITLNNISELIGIDKSSASRMLERLIQRKLVVHRNAGEDRRSIELTLTNAAEKLIPQLAKLADDNDKVFFKNLTDQDRKDFLLIIKQLLKANGWKSTTHGNTRIK